MLKSRGILDDLLIGRIQSESKTIVESATHDAETTGFPDPSTISDHLMAD